jgi:hypothetical protein
MTVLGMRIPSTTIEKSGFLGFGWVNKILFWLYKIVQKKVQNTFKVWYYYSKVAVLVIRTCLLEKDHCLTSFKPVDFILPKFVV